ncbi:acyltransferase [Glycomyces sp. NRRL B-16210]|uniref:acyltransferase family protein n=1 Tax=Glycomyces sp. NRRL B-16210 TaxID=1463821 RepID=UPI0004C2B03E|nr:acyltransferase [Glycomyces sp. NRRL B-16210]
MAELLTAPSTREPARSRYLPALDGLRGVAIAGVLLFHTGNLPGGFLGVDLFFVLSGYLITDLMLREVAATGRVSLVHFWGRRIRRLLPALATMLAVVTAVVWSLAPPDLVRTALADGPWAQANLYNWHLLAESASYWDRFGTERVFEHLWSIAVEEQFYVVWPLVVLVLARSARAGRNVAIAAGLISLASLALVVVLVDAGDPTRVYIGTDTRAFSLLLGAFAAVPEVRERLRQIVGRHAGSLTVFSAFGIGAIWLIADGVDSPWLYSGGLFAHSLLSALLIVLCAERPDALVSKVFAWRPLRGLGLVSYSLYLWHWPVIVMLSPQVTGLGGWPWTALVLAVSLALAVLSKHLVEDPIRYRAQWARGRRGLIAFAAVMILLAAMWALLPAPAPPVIDVGVL